MGSPPTLQVELWWTVMWPCLRGMFFLVCLLHAEAILFRYDFFLVSQSVNQGTVNPTSYNVVKDTSGLLPKHIQALTYKLTHLYYNWPGTVRVPAPCQYAHKLAFLVSNDLHILILLSLYWLRCRLCACLLLYSYCGLNSVSLVVIAKLDFCLFDRLGSLFTRNLPPSCRRPCSISKVSLPNRRYVPSQWYHTIGIEHTSIKPFFKIL